VCGLVALWGEGDEALVTSMLEVQEHRGPDGRGIREIGSEAGTLGHCRLAIIDPDGGQQPLARTSGGWTLVANGMIYNDAELRRRHHNAPFETGSDSESILHAVADRGVDAVADLDGMFAFVMTDGERLIAARDPIGIKPLYMGRRGKALAFASEAKAMAGAVDEIREFPAGHVFDSAHGLYPYYVLPDGRTRDWTLPEAVETLRGTLEAAVVKRLRSDVPFGSLLSGGLDSSIIAALAKRHVPDLKTFAVGLEGSSDLAAARRVAAHLGTDHRELVIRPEQVADVLPRVLYHLESFDQDLVRSAVPCWFVAEFAAREVKVVLTGEGADELFAGYTYYRDIREPAALRDELRRSIAFMHNINLQRVDRMTMAHGLEARVPFLDTAMIELGLSLPVDWKLKPVDGAVVEKWLLRKAFEDLLPDEIVWRKKLQFDQGSGFSDLLSAAAHDRQPSAAVDGARSAEEAWYRNMLIEQLDHPELVLRLVSHWDIRQEAGDA
jgi:asparagine synthase (glutamine-hydrolysing)